MTIKKHLGIVRTGRRDSNRTYLYTGDVTLKERMKELAIINAYTRNYYDVNENEKKYDKYDAINIIDYVFSNIQKEMTLNDLKIKLAKL